MIVFEHKPLELLDCRPISIPEQRILSKSLMNCIPAFVVSVLEQRILGIDKTLKVTESTYNSPIETRFPENNTLKVRHYQPKDSTEQVVIILPQRGSGYNFAQLIALYLASNGINAYEVGIPLRASRLPRGVRSVTEIPLKLDDLKTTVRQAVTEIRGLIDLLDYENIGICGVSLGAIYSSIVYGVDDRVSSACLILGGGDLAGMILESEDRFAKKFRSYVMKNAISEETLRRKFDDIEPCNYVSSKKADNVLMINAEFDKDVPERYGMCLKEAWGNPNLYLVKAGHISTVKEIHVLLPMILCHYEKTLK